MTKNKTKIVSNEAQIFCLETIELKGVIELEFLELGRRLCRISRERLWESHWAAWDEYLHELRLSPASASKLTRIYSILIEKYKFPPAEVAGCGGWTVIAEALPEISRSRSEAEKWIRLAGDLPRVDLRRSLLEGRKGTDMLRCPHEDTILIRICRSCGLRMREFDDKGIKNLSENEYDRKTDELVAAPPAPLEEAPAAARGLDRP